jgi:nitroreductase
MNVSEAVASRRAVRAFLDRPVRLEVLERVMEKARWTPSGCNFQPWEATILTGEPLRELQTKILAAQPQQPAEYSYSDPEIIPKSMARFQGLRAGMYGPLGIRRGDPDARDIFRRRNAVSYDAPVLLVCYMDRRNSAAQWSDTGMWLQTVMLLLREEGLDSCGQEFMSLHARLIKDHIGVADETHILFCGVAIGYRDPEATINHFARERKGLDETVRYVGFEQ